MYVAGFVVAALFVIAPVSTQTLVYPPSDPAADIAAAIAAAKADGKHVLIDFGADWCPDCRVLGALFEDAAVAPIVASNFHVVHVDVGRRDKNAEIVAKYRATSDAWIPAVVILDGRAASVAATDERVRLTRRTTPAELAEILRQWAPKKAWAELAAFRLNGIDVTVWLDKDTAGRDWLAARFAPVEAGVHLYSKDLPANGIDGLGRPTALRIAEGGGLTVAGVAIADRTVESEHVELLNQTLPVYPAGPVTLRIPVVVERAAPRRQADLLLTYMACGGDGCLPPVIDHRISVTWPAGLAGSRPRR